MEEPWPKRRSALEMTPEPDELRFSMHIPRRPQAEEVPVKDLKDQKGHFSRVLKVDYETGGVLISAADLPKKGSPSSNWQENPYRFKYGIWSTMRIQVWADISEAYGTFFSLSPDYGVTCDHVVQGSTWSRAIKGGMVHDDTFCLARKGRYHLQLVEKEKNDRVDFALLKVSTTVGPRFQNIPPDPKVEEQFDHFLLPCSPKLNQSVGTISFPGVTEFLLQAYEALIELRGDSIWAQYKPAMREEIEQQQFKHKHWSEDAIEIKARMILYQKLLHTFSNHSTGCMTASRGLVTSNNAEKMTTSCSLLGGSSGGPICPADLPGYFCGFHRGATEDWLLNQATSCDSEEFAAAYFRYVLGDLPPPDDEVWKNYNMYPFFKWLLKHGEKCKVYYGRAEEKWIQVAQFHLQTPPASRKRARGQ